MKRSLLALILVFNAAVAVCQSGWTTVTASHIYGGVSVSNSLLPAGTILFQATDNTGKTIAYQVGGIGQQINWPLSCAITNGVAAANCQVADTTQTNPVDICYSITIKNSNGQIILGGNPKSGYQCAQPSTATWNFDTFVPFVPGWPLAAFRIATTSSTGIVQAPNCTMLGPSYLPQSLNSDGSWNCIAVSAIAGVSTFNGRAGTVNPQVGDYTPPMIGLGNVQNVDQTNASNILSGTLNASRLPSTITSNTTGNANTSTTSGALAAVPGQCSSGLFATGIQANGTANCGTPSGTGNVSTSGTPVAGTLSGWFSANTVGSVDLTGDVQTSGTLAATVKGTNGLALPVSATVVGTNSSGQIIPQTGTLSNNTSGSAASLSGTSALPNGTTATTQSSGDGSTKVATDAFVRSVLPTTLPPNGPAGGDLNGNYPNPGVTHANAATTAAALASVPAQCTSGQFATGITVNGTANCSTPAGSGNVSTSGTPTTGTIATWASGTTIGTGNLSGDVSTSGSLATTVTGVNGSPVPASSTLVGTNSSSQLIPQTGTIANNTTGSAASLSSASALPNGTTGTTQTTADSTTKLATDAFVHSALPTSLPPSGAASGDLNGTYPAPGVAQVNGAAVPASATVVGTNSSRQIVAQAGTIANNTSGTASNLSGTPALPNGTTASTQTLGDGTGKLATDAFVGATFASPPAIGNTAPAPSAVTNVLSIPTQPAAANTNMVQIDTTGNVTNNSAAIETGTQFQFLDANGVLATQYATNGTGAGQWNQAFGAAQPATGTGVDFGSPASGSYYRFWWPSAQGTIGLPITIAGVSGTDLSLGFGTLLVLPSASTDPSSPITAQDSYNTSLEHQRIFDATQEQSALVGGDLDQLNESAMGFLLGQNSLIELQLSPALHQAKQDVIACIGDSHTAGYPDDMSWCGQMTKYLHRIWGNGGPGWTSADGAATASFIGSNGATPHNPAPGGCTTTVTNATDWTEEFNGIGKSSGSPDDTDIASSTSGDQLTLTCQNIGSTTSNGGFTLYYPTCVSGCGSFTYAVDANSSQGTINENTGTAGYATLAVTTLDGTNAIPEGQHALHLTLTTSSPTYFFGADGQDKIAALSNGYGVRVHKLGSNSEAARDRNANANFGAQLYNTSNCQGATPGTNNLCVNSFLVMYAANERNRGYSIAASQSDWNTLNATLAAANAQSDQTWLSEPDNGQTCSGGCQGTMGQFSSGMRDRTQAWTVSSSTQPVGFYNVWQLFSNFTQGESRFLMNTDGVHLTDAAKNFLGEFVAAAIVKTNPRVRARTPLDLGPLTTTVTNSGTGAPVINLLAKINGLGNLGLATTSDTSIPLGVCIAGCAATGSGEQAIAGIAPLVYDGAASAGHYVVASTSSSGEGHDSGFSASSAPTQPGSGCVAYLGVIPPGGAAGGAGLLGKIDLSKPFTLCAAGTGSGYTVDNYSVTTGLSWTSGTDYYLTGNISILPTTSTLVGTIEPFCTKVYGLSVGLNAAVGTGNTFAFTVRDGTTTTDTSSTCSITATNFNCTDTTHQPTWTAGDGMVIHATCTGTCGVSQPQPNIRVYCR